MHRYLVVTALASVLVAAASAQTAKTFRHHAVFQMSEPEAEWGALIAHVTNLQNALEKDGGVDVEVVFFGPGINMLRKTNTNFAEGLTRLANRGVTLAACQNSMRDRGIKTEDLFSFVSQVDSGVAELTRKQEAGWAYIK